jgi:hypothetical protein
MQDADSTDAGLRTVRIPRKEKPEIETVAGELKVWRDRDTDEIVIEPSALALAKKPGGRIALSARNARHLANSLLLFAEETE